MTHGDARQGKWRGNWRMEWVASTLHTTSEHGVSSITTADAHTSAASSRLNWCPPPDPFRRKTKSGFCVYAITFQTQSTTDYGMDVVVDVLLPVCNKEVFLGIAKTHSSESLERYHSPQCIQSEDNKLNKTCSQTLKTESLNFRKLYSLGQFCTKASIPWRQADCPLVVMWSVVVLAVRSIQVFAPANSRLLRQRENCSWVDWLGFVCNQTHWKYFIYIGTQVM